MTNRTCIIVENGKVCGKLVVGQKMCRKHYTRWTRHRDPLWGAHLPPVGSGGVYSITCLVNGWVYIGESATFRQRWSNHRSHLKTGRHAVAQLQADYDKYGLEAFCFEALRVIVGEAERIACEGEHIAAAKATGKCYNPSPGHGCDGYRFTPEQRQRVSDGTRGKPKSAEHRANLWQDRAVTPEFREQMAANGRRLKGVEKSDETRDRMSAAQADRKLLTEPEVRQIKRLIIDDELTGSAIGRQFGVGPSAISAIRSGRTWGHVLPADPEAAPVPAEAGQMDLFT